MRIRGNVLPFAAASLTVFFLCCGCAPNKQAVKPGRPGVAIRLPPLESMDIRSHPESREAPPNPPFSVADEYRGRWLTLFEVNVSPVSTGTVPKTGSGEDAR